ncbi:hypothetical protein VHUM_02482 [Vanrija humicola]|uniref:Major facilitator superfamily (MFS) profile domain-containing protein n=1 Tax=Vanrija humicola TaxID=5417 RepID=A0A7D8V1K3_VANHU|nr:hypothetical protein VHUM_02482 [Vanrija humicola]
MPTIQAPPSAPTRSATDDAGLGAGATTLRAEPSRPESLSSETATANSSYGASKSPGVSGIQITRYRSLEGVSPAAPLARILSHPRARSPWDNTPASPQDDRHPNPYPGTGTPDDPYLVDFLPGEAANPYNWSSAYRWGVTAVVAVSTLCIAFCSSAYASTLGDVERRFHVSTEVGIVGLSLYVLGFGVGPLIWAPLSEIYGRTAAFVLSYPLFCVFNLVCAVSQNIETLLIARLLAGTFGSSPITNAGAQISDMWASHERALATTLFSLAPFLGPVFGPIVGGFVAEFKGFRWVYWVQFFFSLTMLILTIFLVPETYAPTLLRRKAKRLQKEADDAGTGEHFIAKYDKVKRTRADVFKINMRRPFQLAVREVIVFSLGIYGAIVYATLYLFFAVFPIVFRQYRGWSLGVSGLAFIGMGIGLVIGNCLTPLFTKYYNRAVANAASRGEKVAPEARLIGACVGAVLLPVGLFWFAWTSTPNVHWIVPIIASVPFGAGFLLIFSSMTLYLIDAYELYAASALASAAVLRAVFAAVFPLFTTYMYKNLGLHWAGTLVAFLSLSCTPMPFLFHRYGAILRRNSKYAPSKPRPADNVDKVPQPQEEDALEPEYGPDAGEHAAKEHEKRTGSAV